PERAGRDPAFRGRSGPDALRRHPLALLLCLTRLSGHRPVHHGRRGAGALGSARSQGPPGSGLEPDDPVNDHPHARGPFRLTPPVTKPPATVPPPYPGKVIAVAGIAG